MELRLALKALAEVVLQTDSESKGTFRPADVKELSMATLGPLVQGKKAQFGAAYDEEGCKAAFMETVKILLAIQKRYDLRV